MFNLQDAYYFVGILAGVAVLGGFIWRMLHKIAVIELEVTNHLPSLIKEVKKSLEAHEQREEVYWKLVEKFINGSE